MKNLSEIYNQIEILRYQKKSFRIIERKLRVRGFNKDDIRQAINRLEREEKEDYNRLINVVDDLNYNGTTVLTVLAMLLGLVLFISAFYFFYKFYDIMTTPMTIVKEHVIIKKEFVGIEKLGAGTLFLGFVFLIISLPLFGAGIKNFKKIQENRKRFLFIKERL